MITPPAPITMHAVMKYSTTLWTVRESTRATYERAIESRAQKIVWSLADHPGGNPVSAARAVPPAAA
jgi:hypothetical protein